LCKPDAASRDGVAHFLQRATSPSAYFDTPLIKCSVFLEQWSLKEQYEKDEFIRQIATSIDSFPIEFSKFKVLPELITALEYGGAGAKALTPILKIGSKLENQKEFDEYVGPAVIKLFASTDRAIRVTLCENIGQFMGNLNEKTVTEKIFPNLAIGFNDSNAIVREQTLKAILALTPKVCC
jgi:SCY1-like protein 1